MSKLLSVDTIYSAFGDPGRIYPYPAKIDIKVTTEKGTFDNILVKESDVSQIFKPKTISGSIPSDLTDSSKYYLYAEPVFTLSIPATVDLDSCSLNFKSSGLDVLFALFEVDSPYTLTDHQYLLTIEEPSTNVELDEGITHRDMIGGGDALITADHYTGLEWLKLSETNGKSIQEIEDDPMFSGWRVANNYEAITFINNIIRSVDPSATLFDSRNGSPAISRSYPTEIDNALREYLGGPAYGWWYEFSRDQPNSEQSEKLGGGGYWSNGSVFDWRYDQDITYSRSDTGVMLVRKGIEPDYIVQTPLYPKETLFSDAQYSTHVGLTWLKLYHTREMSIQEFLDTDRPEFANHRLATQDEVQALLSWFAEEEADYAGNGPTGTFSREKLDLWFRDFGRTQKDGTRGYLGYGSYSADEGTSLMMAGPRDYYRYYYFDYRRSGNLAQVYTSDGLFIVKE
tara:strand:- start:746 stop:2110 length:1365 start_codon:yes stop_codon:yes gene_type:complete